MSYSPVTMDSESSSTSTSPAIKAKLRLWPLRSSLLVSTQSSLNWQWPSDAFTYIPEAYHVAHLPVIPISPQNDNGQEVRHWWPEKLDDVYSSLKSKGYPIDWDQLHLSGYSMGGRGTWRNAVARPDVSLAMPCLRTSTNADYVQSHAAIRFTRTFSGSS